jgi:perosamine synthetase
MKIPLTRPLTGPEEHRILQEVVESGWLTQGNRVAEFEAAVANYVGTRHAIASSNCTTSLHIALLLHGIGSGDEVVVPSYTWIATANVVRMVGATPVFADIDLDTFNVTAATLQAAITPRTRALMPVHQFGMPADIDGIAELARQRKLILIEDAACAVGSRYKRRPIGGHGNTTCFSFHPRKLVTTGEGGMLITNDDRLAARARVLINHGASASDLVKHKAGTVEALLAEEFQEVGYNYRMTNLQGALGVVQMRRLDSILEARRTRARRYSEAFSVMPGVIAPRVPSWAEPNWQSYAIRVPARSRNAIARALLDADIACRPAYMACHVQPVYRSAGPVTLARTDEALASVIILPLYPQMTDAEQDYVIDHVGRAARN